MSLFFIKRILWWLCLSCIRIKTKSSQNNKNTRQQTTKHNNNACPYRLSAGKMFFLFYFIFRFIVFM